MRNAHTIIVAKIVFLCKFIFALLRLVQKEYIIERRVLESGVAKKHNTYVEENAQKQEKSSRNSSARGAQAKMNIMLALGLCLVLLGIFFLVAVSTTAVRVIAVRPAILLGIGVVCLFLSLAFMQNSLLIFAGLFCLLCGICTLLIDTKIISYTLRELWPTIMINMGLALFPAGLYKLKRVRTIYLFPAIMMVVLGAFFLLFSLRVVHLSLASFVSRWWPVVLLGGGIALVVIFLVQQANSKHFPYMEDDSLVEGEGE